MAKYFVDASTGNDTNNGRDNIGAGLATADWTEGTFTLTQNGHGYTFASGDVIYVGSGVGVTFGLYEVASSTVNTIVLVETSTLPGIGNASDFAAGDLSGSDIGSSSGPFLTIDKAMNTDAAGDFVWVRATADYTETCAIDTAGGATNTPIVFEGYTTTLGDKGKATIDATGQTSAMTTVAAGGIYHIFKNLKFEDATSHGIGVVNADRFICKNCEFNNNGGAGAVVGNGVAFEGCLFSGNTGDGINAENHVVAIGCRFLNNGGNGVETNNGGYILDCVFFSCGTQAINFVGGSHDFIYIVYGCTIDGDTKDTTVGVDFSSSERGLNVVVNSILYDCATGIGGLDQGARLVSRNNLVNANTADYDPGYETFEGEVTGAPVFTTEGSDFTLQATSPAKGAGYDAAEVAGGSSSRDIGAHQSAGGGLGGANKRAGKQ